MMAEAMTYGCPMCPFVAPSVALLLSHLRLLHSNDPRFLVRCGIEPGCTYTARTFSALYSHVYRKHRQTGVIRSRSSTVELEEPAGTVHLSDMSEQCFEQFTGAGKPIRNRGTGINIYKYFYLF